VRKSALLIRALAFTSVFGGVVASNAAHCGTSTRSAHDPFGSCETSPNGNVKCGRTNATEIGTGGAGQTSLGYLIVDPSKGAQVCSEDGQGFPISGRITAYKHSGNKVTVAADGGDTKNSGGAAAWDRVDVDADNRKVCAARGASGTYWTAGGGHSAVGTAAGEFDQCTP
jgi:hypothetical protein